MKHHRLLLLLILGLAFALRAYGLDYHALRGDEAASVHYSTMPVLELWELSRLTDPHPPFYYLSLHPWQWLVGEAAWSMRFTGVMAGVLAVASLYALAQRTLRDTRLSLLAAGLLAVNPFQIWQAQDLRSYALFTFLGLLSSLLLWHALHRPARLRWILYVAVTVMCFYTHYYAVFLIAFQGVFVLLNAPRFWARRWAWITSQIAIALLMIPGLGLAYNFIGSAAGGIETIPTPMLIQRASSSLLTGLTLPETWGLWLSVVMAPVWLIGLVNLWQRHRTAASFWLLYFAVPVAGVIALAIDRPFFKERYLIQAQPALMLLLAAGFLTLATVRLPRARWLPVAGSAGLALVLLGANLAALTNYFTDPAYAKAKPWHLYHDYVDDKARPGDVMLTNFPEAAVSYYSPNQLPFYVVPDARDLPRSARLDGVANVASAYERIWFLPLLHQGFDENGDVLIWLDRHADRVDQTFFPAYHLNLYVSPPATNERMIDWPVTFDHGIHLRGYQILDESGDSRLEAQGIGWTLPLKPEESFTLSLYWQAENPTAEPYTVFVHFIAADGFTHTSQDNQPVWDTYPTTAWQPGEAITDKYTLAPPPGLPPGAYQLRVGWYDSATVTRVPTASGTDHVILSMVIQLSHAPE